MPVLALGLAPAHAQNPSSPEREIEEDIIEVTGIRASLASALDTKRKADAVIEAVNAEDIGKFPDKNIAESLQRVTGVSIDRTFGEGERVSIRGSGPELNRILLNGQNIGTGDWQILGGGSRSFNYAILASEIVERLEVYKTPQANIDEGAIGGTVVLHTRDPLDLDNMTITGNLQIGYSDLADEVDPQLSGLFSWKNRHETFGFLVSGVWQDRSIRRDGIEVLGYRSFPPTTGDDILPFAIGSALFQQERQRRGFNAVIQYQPNDNIDMRLHGLYSRVDADNRSHNYLAVPRWKQIDRHQEGHPMAGSLIDPPTDVTRDDGIVTRATFTQPTRYIAFDGITRESEMETKLIDLDVDYEGESSDLHFQIGYTEGSGGTSRDLFIEYIGNTGGRFDISGAAPTVSFDTVDPTDPADLTSIGGFHVNSRTTTDEEFYTQLDYTKRLDLGALNSIQFGLKYRDQEKAQQARGTSRASVDDIFKNPNGIYSFANRVGGNTPGDFLDGISISGSLDAYPLIDLDSFENEVGNMMPTDFLDPRNSWTIQEKILAGYGMANFETGNLRGNLGVRVVYTDSSAESYFFTGSWFDPEDIELISQDSTRTDVLPSSNITFDLSNDMILRFAAARAMARAEFSRLAPSLTVNNATLTGTGGNPDLEPQFSIQFDFSWEWYFNEGALFSAGVFYKDIEGYLDFVTTTEEISSEACATDVCRYEVTRPINAGSGTNKGIETNFQQNFDNGLGFVVNYTFSDANAPEDAPIPFNSKHSFNLIGFYENDTFSARVGYNWRSKYFENINRGAELQTDDIGQLDASFAYNIGDNIQLTLEAQNLTDELLYKFGRAERFPRAYYKNGRRVFAGVRVNF
ncbi:MAG: TonB-dependent receptor [Hyphomonadaceae bacterium]|nr:TonB-dependent receptor [Hyphomonadaceae bacterium]